MTRPYRDKPNKSEQIARFMLEQGRAMTANEVFAAGFRFEDGLETNANAISVLLNKLHMSNRYQVERSYITEGRHRMVAVKILSIVDDFYGKDRNGEINLSHSQIWRRLLSSKPMRLAA